MAISDILVYADPTASSAERLDIAFRLAHRFDAYLIGVVPEDAGRGWRKVRKDAAERVNSRRVAYGDRVD